ncbi:MAG: peptidase M3, partial [Muribaculaceae bacterium]|nr:peptidase M3 [Muribaculaceae bacterium]
MKKTITTALVALAFMAGASSCKQDKMQENPFLAEYDTPYEIPPFEQIKLEHYMPALQAGIEEHNAEIKAIVDNEETPTFDNTILALDRSGRTLDKVAAVYFALSESNSSKEMQEMGEEFESLYQAHSDEMMMNDGLFERVKYLYDRRDSLGLAPDQHLAVENMYKDFTRNGALLDAEKKEQLKAL